MFGLENGKGKALMEFDLEKELQKDAQLAKKTLVEIEAKIGGIKKDLREGSGSEGFEQLGVLLHGYTALERVLKRVVKS